MHAMCTFHVGVVLRAVHKVCTPPPLYKLRPCPSTDVVCYCIEFQLLVLCLCKTSAKADTLPARGENWFWSVVDLKDAFSQILVDESWMHTVTSIHTTHNTPIGVLCP